MTSVAQARHQAGQVVLYAEFTAKAGEAERVEALLREYRTKVIQEPGCLQFDGFRRREDGDRFFVFEIYKDEASFSAHLAAEYGAAFNAQLQPLIRETASNLFFLDSINGQ